MDELLLATYQHADWSGYAASQYQMFASSSTREIARDECLVNYACSKDDAGFLNTPKKNYKRVQWVLEIIDWHCRNIKVRSTDVFAELLEGTEEDIWLWVDGDEADLPRNPNSHRLPKQRRSAAMQSLERRGQPMAPTLRFESNTSAEMRRRVQSESLPVRLASIAWLIISSKAMKKLEYDYGFSDRVNWDLEESIWGWFHRLDGLKTFNDIPAVSFSHLKEFEAAMVANGHSCITKMLSESYGFLGHDRLGRWLYIQDILYRGNIDKSVNFMYRCGPNGEVECKTCLDYANTYYPPEQYSYVPSEYSVLLAVIWNSMASESDLEHVHSIIDWVSQLRYSYEHLFTAGKALCQTFTLTDDPLDTRYLPWVNTYPKDWRGFLTGMFSSVTWRLIDSFSNSVSSTLPYTQTDPITWLLSALLTISVHSVSSSSNSKTKCQQIHDFYRFAQQMTVIFDRRLFFIGQPLQLDINDVTATSTMESFRHKVETSLHTCWNDYNPGWYAAAVAYLYSKDDIEFVPLLRPAHCSQCDLTCAARMFANEILDSTSLSSSTSREALQALLQAMKNRYEKSDEIALLRSTFEDIMGNDSSSSDKGRDVRDIPLVEVSPMPPEAVLPICGEDAQSDTTLLLTTRATITQLKHDDMLDEVKKFLINDLLKAGAFLNLKNGEFTLPWSQLRSKLVEWNIEMVNWPEKVPLKDKKKGINGLNSHFVQMLYRAIHDKERPLHFRRISQTTAESRKRAARDCDDIEQEGPPAKKLNISS